jgi:PAS domain S-box-containing protein
MVQTLQGKYLKALIALPIIYSLLVYGVWIYSLNNTHPPVHMPQIALYLFIGPLLYYAFLFKYTVRHIGRTQAYVIGLLTAFVPAIIITTVEGYTSPHMFALGVIMLIAPMLGPTLPSGLFGIHMLGVLLNYSGSMSMPGKEYGIVALLSFGLCGLVGWLLFHRYYTTEDAEANRIRKVLREEQLRSETLIASLTDGVVIIDKHGVIQLCNTVALSMLNMKNAEVVGQNYLAVAKGHVANSDSQHHISLKKAVSSVLTSKKAIVINALTVHRADGDDITVSCGITPVIDDDGDTGAVLLTMHDVSNYVELQNIKDEFISTASHELRTPMTVIAGYSDLLLNPMFGELTEKQQHYVTRTKETTKQLISLVNDMLDITKLESGKLEDNPQVIGLGKFSEVFIANLAEELAKKQLSIDTKLEDVDIFVDKNRLNLVYSNLLSNAIKFSDDNKAIEFKMTAHSDRVEVSVKDNGPGVPKELQKEIFTKFSRTKSTISADKFGTGLGLAIASEIVRGWGGIIGVDSDGINGSKFYFTIPRSKQTADKENTA